MARGIRPEVPNKHQAVSVIVGVKLLARGTGNLDAIGRSHLLVASERSGGVLVHLKIGWGLVASRV